MQIYTGLALAFCPATIGHVPLFFSYRICAGGDAGWARSAKLLPLYGLGACTVFCLPAANAARSHRQSEIDFARAQNIQRHLDSRPVAGRTRTEYNHVLDAYRAVYHGDPGSPDAAPSVAAVADLLASEGRAFHDAKLLHDAVAQNEFLRREYPGSPLCRRALLQEAAIEQRDLRHATAAKKLYRTFLTRYPHDALAEEARAGLSADLDRERPRAGTTLRTAASAGVQSMRSGPTETVRTRPEVFATETVTNVTTIQAVRYWTVGTTTRLAVDMSGAAPYHAYLAPDGTRITLIFFDSQPAGSLLTHAIDLQQDAYVRSIHTSSLTAHQTEIVIDLHRPARFSTFRLPGPERVILDIQGGDIHGGDIPARDSPAGTRPAAVLPVRQVPVFSDLRPAIPPAKQFAIARRAERISPPTDAAQHSAANALAVPALTADPIANGQRSMARILGLRVRRIVIDAGHGGHDSGTLGPGGIEEKDIALDVALRLGHLLHQRLGADIIYTRTTDVFVPLESRTAIANRSHADLFLSLHANSSADPQARGVETYFLNFTASPSALAVAARENAVSNRSVYELSDLVRRITLSDKINESREFAGDVQQSLYAGLASGNPGLKNRGVKQAPFMVLIGANMPSILAEISFLTNPADASELTQPTYRERLAEALYRGVARYVDGMSGIRVAKTAPPQVIAAPAE